MATSSLTVQEIEGLLVVDSRLVAERLGVQHEALMRTIGKYTNELQGFGVLRFENGKLESGTTGRPQRFCYLNESQATLLMTMSRNTAQVVACKVELVSAFEKAKQVIKSVIPAQNDRIRELELEIKLREAEAGTFLAEQKLLDTRHYITTALPEVVQQKILGYSLVEKIEYRDRVIQNDELIRDGSTVNKTTLCKRLKFFTKNGKPDFKRLNTFLVACNLPESAWRLTAAIQENLELTAEAAIEVERRWAGSVERSRYIGE